MQPPPRDLEVICGDLKVCGRGELFSLLKYRTKFQATQESEKKKARKAKSDASGRVEKELTPEELEEQTNKELEETIKRVEKERRKQEKKERERKAKADLRQKMSVIASTDHNQNDDVLFDRRTLEKLKAIDIEELDY